MEPQDSRVYLVQSGKGGPIKIGWSTQLSARVASLRVEARRRGYNPSLRLLRSMPGGPATEKHLHQRFTEARIDGEWFRPAIALLLFAASTEEPFIPEGPIHPLDLWLQQTATDRDDFARNIDTTKNYINQIIVRHRFPSRPLAEDISKATGGAVAVDQLIHHRARICRHIPVPGEVA